MTSSSAGTTRRRFLRSPGQVIVSAFGAGVVVGTVLLLLPISRVGPGGAPLITALFTATSAICVTGLITVDTATYWTGFGQAVILVLIQVGGLGIMALASLVGLLLFRRMGLRTRLTAATETRSTGMGDVRAVLFGVVKVSLLIEAVVAVVLTARFLLGHGEPPARAIYLGVSTPSRPSTTRASPCTRTTSWASRHTRGCACPSPLPSSWGVSASPCCWNCVAN